MNQNTIKNCIDKNMLGGLTNLCNTCYLNTALQCLYNVKDLNFYFLFEKDFKSELRKNSNEKTFTLCYYETLQLLLSNKVLRPMPLLKNLLELCNKKGIPCRLGNQEDSQEYLLYIIDFIHEALKYDVNAKFDVNIKNELDKELLLSYKSWNNDISKDYSIITDLFYGQFKYNIYKEEDLENEISIKFEKFNSISLPITEETKNLKDCLNNFMINKFYGENRYYYEKEKKKINAIRKCYLCRLPKYLIISFKRFSNNNKKDNSPITFPIDNLDLSDYTHTYNKYKSKYNLISVGCHRGNTNFGHYYALTRKSKSIWFLYNDSSISKITDIQKAINSAISDPYYLIYKKYNDTIDILSDDFFLREFKQQIDDIDNNKLFINTTLDDTDDINDYDDTDDTDDIDNETDNIISDETDNCLTDDDENNDSEDSFWKQHNMNPSDDDSDNIDFHEFMKNNLDTIVNDEDFSKLSNKSIKQSDMESYDIFDSSGSGLEFTENSLDEDDIQFYEE